MTIVICADKNGGTLFNNRRQSRDSKLIEDMVSFSRDKAIFASPYSEKLFEGLDVKLKVRDNPIRASKRDSVCFIENVSPKEYKKEIDEVVLYHWNRHYPADFSFDLDMEGYTLISTVELVGSSHDKITKEVWKK